MKISGLWCLLQRKMKEEEEEEINEGGEGHLLGHKLNITGRFIEGFNKWI